MSRSIAIASVLASLLISAGCGSAGERTTADPASSNTGTSDPATSAPGTTSAETSPPTLVGPPATEHEQLSEAATAQINVLVAVAVTRVTVDNSFGGQAAFASMAVVDRLGNTGSDGFIDVTPDAVILTQLEQEAIAAALAPITVQWIASAGRVESEIMAGDSEFDAILTLAVPDIAGDEATVTSSLYCGGLCAIGGAHTLERQPDNTWLVTGQTGMQWIS